MSSILHFPRLQRGKKVDEEKEKTKKEKKSILHTRVGRKKKFTLMKTNEHIWQSRQGQMKCCWQYFMHIFY